MKRYEWITAQGTGHWYHDHEVVFATVTVVTYNRSGTNTKTCDHYELRYRLPGGARWDRRSFDSAEARSRFVEESFSELALVSEGEALNVNREMPYPLSSCVSERVSRISVRLDGVEIDLGEGHLMMYIWPHIQHDGVDFVRSDSGYGDRLCLLLGEKLLLADDYLDEGLELKLGHGLSLHIPMSSEELSVEELEFIKWGDGAVAVYHPSDTDQFESYAWFADDPPLTM
jgi:hypothetical protein